MLVPHCKISCRFTEISRSAQLVKKLVFLMVKDRIHVMGSIKSVKLVYLTGYIISQKILQACVVFPCNSDIECRLFPFEALAMKQLLRLLHLRQFLAKSTA